MIIADYVIVGAGASGMAFADEILANSGSTVALIDKRSSPGGHWTECYPFIFCEQPSDCYGVNSIELPAETESADGLSNRSSGIEIRDYFLKVLESFETTGRVKFYSNSFYSWREQEIIASDGARVPVVARKAIVNGTLTGTELPSSHKRSYHVDEDVALATPNELHELQEGYKTIYIVGSGKTSFDCIVSLLDSGRAPDSICWIKSRDRWYFNREILQSTPEFAHKTIGAVATQYRVAHEVSKLTEYALRLEEEGIWLRVNPNEIPTTFKGGAISVQELQKVRRIQNILNQGYVTSISAKSIQFKYETVSIDEGSLFVDCTACGVPVKKTPEKIFEEGCINLLPTRNYQVAYSSALIGKLSTMGLSNTQLNEFLKPLNSTDTIADWAKNQLVNGQNETNCFSHPELIEWLTQSRLNGFAKCFFNQHIMDDELLKSIDTLKELSDSATYKLANMGL